MGPSRKVKFEAVVRLVLISTVAVLTGLVPLTPAKAARDGVRDLQTRTGSIQEIGYLMAEKNWPALSRLIRIDPSTQFNEALAHIIFRHPAAGEIYRLQIEMIERGSPGLITAVAKTGFAAAWVTSDSPIGHPEALDLAQNILRTFPESASPEIQGLLFDTRYVQNVTESMMRDFFSRASKEFLTSKIAIGYFTFLLESGLLSKEQTRLIEFAIRNGADIYDAGNSPRARRHYLDTELATPRSGGSCGNLFAAR